MQCPLASFIGGTMPVMRHALKNLMQGTLVAAAIMFAIMLGTPAALAQGDKPHVEVYGFVMADYIQDFNRVDPDWQATLRPSKIPTSEGEFGADGQAIISAR